MMAAAIEPTGESFGRALSALLRETEYTTQMGNPNLRAFAEQLDGVHYETLRKAMTSERQVTPHIMEEVARVLGIDPAHFVEYRLYLARKQFDVREVGLERALENLEAWAVEERKRGGKRGRRR